MRKTIVITGGHHNCALVIAEKLRLRGYRVIWFGHKYTMLGDCQPGAEYREVTQAGFKFVEIKAGKIGRRFLGKELIGFPRGFLQSFYYLLVYRPDLVFSFGGYLAFPVVISAFLLRIPSITHEQTVVYGFANRIISYFAQKVCVSWKVSSCHFPSRKIVFTGLPLRDEILSAKKTRFFPNHLPIIYITGGKQGSHIINRVVKKNLPLMLEKYNIIHQCGSSTLHYDYSHLKIFKKKLCPELQERYLVKDYFFRSEIGSIFASADLIVSRAGAHIVYELAALGKPVLFIPYPWSHASEQNLNAQILVKVGTARVLPQGKLTSEELSRVVGQMIRDLYIYRKNSPKARQLVKLNAADQIIDLIQKYV
ncbi:MAG TPA: UDP-N-acetylglucosamine--N-acetylmuramyl-(pentapeptide) pyrophosphoryl-undecaprenol N-acetylglucosamine transferase [Candidatus Bathyarchaeia archaeon]|nr:UDP-N-acetylglucosamine--N-acetylmuramyl-(pentapeptide) pyrophosphoryl-undecaprenol N-acetylglucosamine transferase [Candidatus Bathyarchaeia archaeon]